MQVNEENGDKVGAPEPTFAIGAVGLRALDDESGQIGAAVRSTFQEVMTEHHGKHVSLLTSVAEGADRIFVQSAIALGLPYDCVLPCSSDCFREDFATEASRQQFDSFLAGARSVIEPSVPLTKDDGYYWASQTVLDGCNLLVAVWNGSPGKGPAGTAATVADAQVRGIPVICIPTDGLATYCTGDAVVSWSATSCTIVST